MLANPAIPYCLFSVFRELVTFLSKSWLELLSGRVRLCDRQFLLTWRVWLRDGRELACFVATEKNNNISIDISLRLPSPIPVVYQKLELFEFLDLQPTKWHFYSSRKNCAKLRSSVTLTFNLPDQLFQMPLFCLGEKLCQIILKSMHKCRRYGPE